jgi:hypothetical protein
LLIGINKDELNSRQAGEVLQSIGKRLSLLTALVNRGGKTAQRYFRCALVAARSESIGARARWRASRS